MTSTDHRGDVTRFVGQAVSGETVAAIDFTIQLLDTGVSKVDIIGDVMAPAQREVGDRWQRGELSVADEHLASGVTESALYALASAPPTPRYTGSVVVACAPGNWHSIAGHMIAEQLQAEGVATAFLGASTPAVDVGRFLATYQPNAIAITCALPLFFSGVTELADVAHELGVPVMAGGHAFEGHPEWATRIGADAYAGDVASALSLLKAWETVPPDPRARFVPDENARELDARAGELAPRALSELTRRFPAMASYSSHQRQRTEEDLAYMVRFAAAALYVNDNAVFTEFLAWLIELLRARGVPKEAVVAGLESLQTLPELRQGRAGDIIATGLSFCRA